MKESELRALELKYAGKIYREIAVELNVTESAVGKWFMIGGILHDKYRIYEDEQNKIRVNAALRILKSNMNKAAQKLADLLNDPDPKVALAAAKAILEKEIPTKKEHRVFIPDTSGIDRLIDAVTNQDEEKDNPKPDNKH